MPQLSLQDLYSLNDKEVTSTVTSTFIQQLKNSPSVRGVFFGSEPGAPAPHNSDFVDRIATSMVCSSIAKSSLYGFAKCVNAGVADGYWKGKLIDTNADAVAEGQALYQWAFPDRCKSPNATFRDYLNDKNGNWGKQLADKVISAPFMTKEILEVLALPNWLAEMNVIFYKIQQLDGSQVAPVLAKWTAAYADRKITNTWNTKTFVPAGNFQTVPEQFIGQVNGAIMVRSVIGRTLTPGQGGPSGSAGRSWDRYGFGVAVQGFLGGRPAQLGLTTGQSPDNDPDKGAGCFVAGTRVQLADGRAIAIEEVREGDAVVGRGGAVSVQTDERVILELEDGEIIYGIDDGANREEPFFSAGHQFWTQEGWKAIDPEIARMENPHREVQELKPGDVVFRLRAADPIVYDEVRIRDFTRGYLPPGGRLYGLHLVDGPHSYHANGYLVAMNYPQFTVQRLAQGFARLSDAERRHLERCLTDAMPLLRRSVGPFIETALRRALAASHSAETVNAQAV